MEKKQFRKMWERWTVEWYNNATCSVNGIEEPVSKYCEIGTDVYEILYESYEATKQKIKKLYFYQDGKLLNKYKRAAVITFVINGSAPLLYKEDAYIKAFGREGVNLPDRLFLKQRLAFYMGLNSIIIEYDERAVNELPNPIFHFPKLESDELKCEDDERPADDFLTSVYKDLFFAEIYHNCDILSLSNVFWLLTDTSELSQICVSTNRVKTKRDGSN